MCCATLFTCCTIICIFYDANFRPLTWQNWTLTAGQLMTGYSCALILLPILSNIYGLLSKQCTVPFSAPYVNHLILEGPTPQGLYTRYCLYSKGSPPVQPVLITPVLISGSTSEWLSRMTLYFSSVSSVAQLCLTLCDPMACSTAQQFSPFEILLWKFYFFVFSLIRM